MTHTLSLRAHGATAGTACRWAVALALPALVLLPGHASAQISMPSTGSPVRPAVTGGHGPKDAATPTPPPALPGAQSSAETVIPAEKGTLDLPPTESLFDAIHRGDMVAARDALNRGADLDGHNVLGQTPLDLSIDLNRNDITFLLLSMRGPDEHARQPTTAVAKAGPAPVLHPHRERSVASRRDIVRASTPAGQAPQLFAGDGGAPKPAVGFLGFGGAGR